MSAMNGFTTLIRAGLVSAAIALVAPPVIAQEIDHSRMPMPAQTPMPNPPAESIDHTAMDHTGKDHGMGAKPSAAAQAVDHSTMAGMTAAPDQPRTPIPALTDADRAAAFPALAQPMEHASRVNRYLLFDQLEWQGANGGAQAWDAKSWIGTDMDRLWLRTEGEREDGRTESAFAEALYGRAISPWWDLLIGVRNDFRPGPERTWAAVGVQGLAPYKFDIEATAYIGESGRSHARIEAEYELLLSNRLIVQPQLEAELYGESDRRRRIGAGLSSVELGVRLRYEVGREFAPYLGVVWSRKFGDSADLSRADGEQVEDTRLVAGIRIWF